MNFIDDLAHNMWDLARKSLEPLVYLSETEDQLIIEVDLPLVNKKDITLRIVDEGLEIQATLTRCVKFERWGTIQKSCEFQSFYKIVAFPNQVVKEEAKATFKKGILRIEFKKRKAIRYKIPIK